MVTKSAILDIDAQIEKLRERKKTLIVKSADRFACSDEVRIGGNGDH